MIIPNKQRYYGNSESPLIPHPKPDFPFIDPKTLERGYSELCDITNKDSGCYAFVEIGSNEVLYVGKALYLKNRLQSHWIWLDCLQQFECGLTSITPDVIRMIGKRDDPWTCDKCDLLQDRGNELCTNCGNPVIKRHRIIWEQNHKRCGYYEANKPPSFLVDKVRSETYRDTCGPSRDIVRKMLKTISGNSIKAIRDRAIMRLIYDLLLQRCEVFRLDLADLNLEKATIAVLGKGRTQKNSITLPPEIVVLLKAWIEIRGTDPGPLFHSLHRNRKANERMTGKGICRMVSKLGKKVDINITSHGPRYAANVYIIAWRMKHKNTAAFEQSLLDYYEPKYNKQRS